MKGAQAVVNCLKEQGIDTIFGYPGGMILPLYDALYDEKDIRQVLVTHEQNAAHAATRVPPAKWGSAWRHRGRGRRIW